MKTNTTKDQTQTPRTTQIQIKNSNKHIKQNTEIQNNKTYKANTHQPNKYKKSIKTKPSNKTLKHTIQQQKQNTKE